MFGKFTVCQFSNPFAIYCSFYSSWQKIKFVLQRCFLFPFSAQERHLICWLMLTELLRSLADIYVNQLIVGTVRLQRSIFLAVDFMGQTLSNCLVTVQCCLLLGEYNKVAMNKQTQKRIKLTDVYNQLTAVKNQLQSLMKSTSPQTLPEAGGKTNNVQPTLHSDQIKIVEKSSEKVVFKLERPREADWKREMHQVCQKVTHMRALNSSEYELKNKKWTSNMVQKKPLDNSTNKSPEKNIVSSAQNPKEELKFTAKPHFVPPKKAFTPKLKGSPETSEESKKKVSHERHLTLFNLTEDGKKQLKKADDFKLKKIVSEKEIKEKDILVIKKCPEIPEDQIRKLVRIKSDFTGLHCDEQKDQNGLKKKVKELQGQLVKKQEAFLVLIEELTKIQSSFKQLQETLLNILRQYGYQKSKLCDVEVNKILIQVLSNSKLQEGQLKRMNIECEKWRKVNLEQEQKIKTLEQKVEEYEKSSATAATEEEENKSLRRQLQMASSKLQISMKETKMKDEFIIKFLMSRNEDQGKFESWITSILEEYRNTCGYPSNRLLQKLAQKQTQIHRLRSLLAKSNSQAKH